MKAFTGICIILLAAQAVIALPDHHGGGRESHASQHGGGRSGENHNQGPPGLPAFLQAPVSAIQGAVQSIILASRLGSPNLVACENKFGTILVNALATDVTNAISTCLPSQSANVATIVAGLQTLLPMLQAGNNAGLAVAIQTQLTTLGSNISQVVAAVRTTNAAALQTCAAPFATQTATDANAFTTAFRSCLVTGV